MGVAIERQYVDDYRQSELRQELPTSDTGLTSRLLAHNVSNETGS